MRVVTLSIMAGAALAFAACGGGGVPAGTLSPARTGGALGPAPTAPSAQGTSPAATAGACVGSAGVPVTIADNVYSPRRAIVQLGGVVTWTNSDDEAHTVTFNTGPDCGEVAPGQSVSRTFERRGNLIYRCTIHTSMRGTVQIN